MSMLSKLKNNSFLRGLCFLTRSIGNHFVVCKKKFAQYADNVVVIPPLCIGNYKNVYLAKRFALAQMPIFPPSMPGLSAKAIVR